MVKDVAVEHPVDQGVMRNNGRPGAARAPEQIRNHLLKLTPHTKYFKRSTAFLQQVFDAGNLLLTGDLEKDQSILSKVVSEYLEQDTIPVIIGGGHETASGLSPELWLKFAFEFGKHKKVSSFDICEVNPLHDIDGQTVRLAALTVWYFLLGLALREEG